MLLVHVAAGVGRRGLGRLGPFHLVQVVVAVHDLAPVRDIWNLKCGAKV